MYLGLSRSDVKMSYLNQYSLRMVGLVWFVGEEKEKKDNGCATYECDMTQSSGKGAWYLKVL